MCNLNNLALGIINNEGLIRDTANAYAQDKINSEYQKTRNSFIMTQFNQQARDLNNSYAQEQRNNSIQKQQNYLKNLQAKSTLLAGKASSGINGNSVENLFRGFDRATAVNNYLYAKDLNDKGLLYDDRLSRLRYSALNSITKQSYYQPQGTSTLLSNISGWFGNSRNSLIRQSKNENQSL